MLKKNHWSYRVLSNKHTYVYLSIMVGLVLSHPHLASALVILSLCLALCATISAAAYMHDRNVSIKKLLAFEQAKVIMKDKEIQEALRRKKEAQYRLRKAVQPVEEAVKDLPLLKASNVVRLPQSSYHLNRFFQ